MTKKDLTLKTSLAQLSKLVLKLRRYSLLAFIALVVLIYGFLLLRINNLGSTPPSNGAIINESGKTKVPHIDESVVRQLKALQDNSVSVQTLFDEARSNPFQ
ncbi:hypothetical protein COY17_00155 [Candidatus Saccharibacteria bacterium CG_4_10_14_0_2_um_filter_52_9]|nr:MAG: hypothetical protein COY17_00155 [Candidatus Saccharibacteria bacterium CG_4_10_14_0_2_um_filter_52_9]